MRRNITTAVLATLVVIAICTATGQAACRKADIIHQDDVGWVALDAIHQFWGVIHSKDKNNFFLKITTRGHNPKKDSTVARTITWHFTDNGFQKMWKPLKESKKAEKGTKGCTAIWFWTMVGASDIFDRIQMARIGYKMTPLERCIVEVAYNGKMLCRVIGPLPEKYESEQQLKWEIFE